MFANLGDGTLFHSGFHGGAPGGAAHVPLTYKVLFNGFVSMTGGQPVDGEMTVRRQSLQQFASEGVKKMAVVTDEPAKYEGVTLPRACRCIRARNWKRYSWTFVNTKTSPSLSTISPAQPNAAVCASVASGLTRICAPLLTARSAKAVAIAAKRRTACRSNRWKPELGRKRAHQSVVLQ